jgi:hypothetical protein
MRKILTLVPEGWPCGLSDCPPGFFLFDNEACFKSEYGDDAYCDSGEIFWGGAPNRVSRDNLIVQPLIAKWEVIE